MYMDSDAVRYVRIHTDTLQCIRIHIDTHGCIQIQMLLDAYGYIQIHYNA